MLKVEGRTGHVSPAKSEVTAPEGQDANRGANKPSKQRHSLPGLSFNLQPSTFNSPATVKRFVKFGIVITVSVTTLVATHHGDELREIAGSNYFLLANLCGIAVAMLWNFLANVIWTWA